METVIEGNNFRTAEGRVATIDLGRALGLNQPTRANEMVPDDEIETVMRLRTVTPSTAASVARRRGREEIAKELENLDNTSQPPAKQNGGPETISRVFQDNEIRIVQKDGEPWLVARDVCDALELSRTESALRRLDDDEQCAYSIRVQSGAVGGHLREMKMINEPGTYRLIFTSRKDEAETFKRWLAHDVLPEIRETGGYNKDAVQPQVTVEPQVNPEVNVSPNVHLDTEQLAGQIAEGIASELSGHLGNGHSQNGHVQNGHTGNGMDLPGADMTPEEMRDEIHTLLGPWKEMDDYNPWTDLYDEAVSRDQYSIAVRTYWRRNLNMEGSKLDAVEAMHSDPNYPPALRVLLDTAQRFFGG